jgi:CDP-paratose 2-epimerase
LARKVSETRELGCERSWMKLFITGICGFVGSRLACRLREQVAGLEVTGIDNLLRAGSELNRVRLAQYGIRFIHGDLRMPSDLEAVGPSDWVIDAAAHPSVLAGLDGRSSPRQLAEHNLIGTLNVLDYCRQYKAGLILLSSSRVYSIRDLTEIPVIEGNGAFQLDTAKTAPAGASAEGINESFSTRAPVSLYGATKLASETMAREYGQAFGFPVWINRCGVLAGAGQFGTAEQGIFSYWLHAHFTRQTLRYIGFGGLGHQVRDAFHPDDLADLIRIQFERTAPPDAIFHAGGGAKNSMSLTQLTDWCNQRFGRHIPEADERQRPFDIPWLVMNCALAKSSLGWEPKRTLPKILDEIAEHARQNEDWLRRTGAI